MLGKKLALFLGLQFVIFIFCQNQLWAQKIVVEKEVANMPLSEYLQILEKKAKVNFSFASKPIEAHNIKIKAGQYDLKDLLNLILEPIHYQAEFVSDEYIVIKSKKKLKLKLSVVDKNTLEPLPFATCLNLNNSQGFVADQHGVIILEVPNDSSLRLKVSYLGYQSKNIKPAIVVSNYTIKMKSEFTTLDKVVITEYLNQGISIDEKSSVVGLNIQDMQILPGLSEPDVLLSSQMLLGINSTDETASGINIRGGTVDQTAFYWNHIPVYNPAHYFGNISSFIPSAIGSVDIYKNFIPVEYGAYTSGLLDLTSRSANDKKTSLEANINLTHAELYLHQKLPAKLGHLMLAGRRSYNDLLLTPTYSSISEKVFEGSTTELFQTSTLEDEFDYNSKINFKDLNIVWANRLGQKDSITISYLYANSLLNFESANEFDITRQQNKAINQGLGINWQHQWDSTFKSSLNVASSQYSLNYGQDNIRNFPGDFDWFESRENELKNLEIRMANSKQLNSFMSLGFGYQFNYLQTSFISNTLDIYPDGTEERRIFPRK